MVEERAGGAGWREEEWNDEGGGDKSGAEAGLWPRPGWEVVESVMAVLLLLLLLLNFIFTAC